MRPGEVGESSCPSLCLCLEATCCFTCAVSATRNYLMDKYRIHPDPIDYQIGREGREGGSEGEANSFSDKNRGRCEANISSALLPSLPPSFPAVRCNNAVQCLSCFCSLAAICIEDLREGARILRHIAHITFCTVQGCMQVEQGGREGGREGGRGKEIGAYLSSYDVPCKVPCR